MSRKANIICTVICIVIMSFLAGMAFFGIVKYNTEKEKENALKDYESVHQSPSYEAPSDSTENGDTTDENNTLGNIPAIKDDPKLPAVKDDPDIDVSEMTKNQEAEVVDSKVECDVKEIATNEE